MTNDSMLWRARYKRSGSPIWYNVSLGLELLDLEDASYCRKVALNDLATREENGEEIEDYELAYTVMTQHDYDFYRFAKWWEKINETRRLLFIAEEGKI